MRRVLQNEIKDWWVEQHVNNIRLYLTGSSSKQVTDFLEISLFESNILNVGIGTGRCTHGFFEAGNNVFVLDICEEAVRKVKDCIVTAYLSPKAIESNIFDFVISHLVVQHMSDDVLLEHLINYLRAIKKDGIIAVQFADCEGAPRDQSIGAQEGGGVLRSKEEMIKIINEADGKVIKWIGPRRFSHTPAIWYGVHIGR